MSKQMTKYFSENAIWFQDKEHEWVTECKICGLKVGERRLAPYAESKSVVILNCSNCGFVWNVRQPTSAVLEDFYQNSKPLTLWSNIKSTKEEKLRQIEKFSYFLDKIDELKMRSVLDVGAGNGYFLSKTDPSVARTAIEPNLAAKEKFPNGIKHFHSYEELILALPHTDNLIYLNPKEEEQYKYDFITMCGVLEHLKDPGKAIEQYLRLLNPKGLFGIIVPNISSMAVMVLGKDCSTFCPQHLHYFSIGTLSSLMEKYDLELEEYITIEPETQPILRKLRGLDPYVDLPMQLTDRDITDDSIINNGLGYKLAALFRRKNNG